MVEIIENYFNKSNTLIRYILIGVLNTIIGISVILLLLEVFNLSYWSSTFIGNSVGAGASYFLNRNFTFKSNVENKKGMLLFTIVLLVSYFIAYPIGYHFLFESIFQSNLIGKELSVLLSACLYTLINYLGQKYITFRL